MGTLLMAFEPVIMVIHFIMAFFLIAVILLQAGKGTDIGAVFGAGARAVLGTSSRTDLFTKLTTVAAVCFLVTSLSLTAISKVSAKETKSVIESAAGQTGTPEPAKDVVDQNEAPVAPVAPVDGVPVTEQPKTE
ncbi:MAG: hypothetical protein ACD_62C00245G0001 [uncultured bacterium]|nr:MAG: hypothetical protein ACD_62C00245G0001 [uncultured bacterium]